MKKILIVLLSLFLAVSCTTADVKDERNTISVRGTSSVTMSADMASFSVSADAIRETSEEAREATDQIITEAVKVLIDKYGVSEEDINTTYLNLSPEYSYIDGVRTLIGQRGNQSINVKLSDISLIGKVVEDLSKINGISISSITLDKKDKSEEIKEARRLAVLDALEKAEAYANAIDKSLGDVILISDGSSNTYVPNALRMDAMVAESAMSGSYSTTFYSYDLTCTDSVSLVVETI